MSNFAVDGKMHATEEGLVLKLGEDFSGRFQ